MESAEQTVNPSDAVVETPGEVQGIDNNVEQVDDLSPEEMFDNVVSGAFEAQTEAPGGTPEIAETATPAETPVTPTEELKPWSTAPQHWPVQDQEKFNALPLDQRQFIYNRDLETTRRADEKMRQAAEIRQTVSQFVDKLANKQPAEAVTPPPPDDPVDRLKWEAKEEIRAELKQEKEQEKIKAIRDQQIETNRIVAADPLRDQTQALLDAKVASEPAIVNPHDPHGRTYQQIEFDRLNLDPVYFRSVYAQARDVVVTRLKANEKPPTPPASNTTSTQVRRTVTPALETPGATVPVAPAGNERKSIVKDIRRGKVNADTLANYLDTVVDDAAFA